jgi:hypothetical protein
MQQESSLGETSKRLRMFSYNPEGFLKEYSLLA